MTWVTCGECVYLCVVMCTLKCLAANARVRVVAFLSSSLHPLTPSPLSSIIHHRLRVGPREKAQSTETSFPISVCSFMPSIAPCASCFSAYSIRQ